MDWNETDPAPLRLKQLPSTSGNPTAVPQAMPEVQAQVPPEITSGGEEIAAPAVLPLVESRLVAPMAQSVDLAVATDIWQRLSQLVRSPARPRWHASFLLSVIGMAGLAGAMAVGNFWLVSLWALGWAAAFHSTRVDTAALYDKDALNMAPFDLRWVGPLTHALNSPHARVRGVAAQLLTHLLPYVREDTAHLLNSKQRAILNQSLRRNRPRETTLNSAILECWAWIGDAEALYYVERLTHSPAWTSKSYQIRGLARECLSRMEGREQEKQAAQAPQAAHTSDQRVEGGSLAALSTSTRAAIADVDTQLDKLREESRKHSNPGMRFGFLLASWLIIVPYTALQAWFAFVVAHSWQAGMVWTLLALLATQLHRFSLSNKQTEAARRLANTDDIRAVGPLAEALEWPDAGIQRVAAHGLTRLLPRLTASDASLLNPKQRAGLYRLLKMRYAYSHSMLIEATLKALQQVGDEAAIPVVERLAKAYAYTDRQRRIQKLAEDTRPLLTVSAQKHGISAQLLRASSAHETPSDLLLRGAMAATEEAPQQLLRAGAAQSEP